MVDTNARKQMDIAKEFSMNSANIKAFRDESLLHGVHWSKSGATIYWTDHAYWLLKKHLTKKPEPVNEFEVQVIGLANNPRFVYGDMNGTRIAISCNANMKKRILRKTITVTSREEGGETYYTHKL